MRILLALAAVFALTGAASAESYADPTKLLAALYEGYSPAHEYPDEEGWYDNFGDAEGSDESVFSIAGVIGAAH